jgi:hypothetical protein
MLKFATPERNLASHNPPECHNPPELPSLPRDAASNVFTLPVRSQRPTRTTDDPSLRLTVLSRSLYTQISGL